MEDEYNAGLFIKEELIPYAIEYYLDLIEDNEDLEDEEDEDFEEEEEENFAKKPKGKK
jgi:hypothetical protein